VALEFWIFPDGPGPYFFPVIVVASSLMVTHSAIFVVASLAALAYVVVARLHGIAGVSVEPVYPVIILIYLTAFAAWLSSRQLHMALAWMQDSYTRASTVVEELREQRLTLTRTLKVLDQAYDRIEKMNYVLIEARSDAEEGRRLKAEFAANISHELRTPLNLIIGFSETMANAPETYGNMTWPSSLRGDVDQIYRSSRHLSALIDDILDLSALDVRQLGFTMEKVNLTDIIKEAVSIVDDLFQAKGLYLKTNILAEIPRLRLDPTRIRQVMLNLLNNASRFTNAGGVTITVQKINNAVQVALTDTGVGIAPQDIPKVFEEFRQIDGSTRRDHEGTGLGIPLSKRLVEFHGGNMWLESEPGQGTTFFFTLPITSVDPLDSARATGQTSTPYARADLSYRKGLLVIEPDPLLLRTLRRHIDGYDVIEIEHQHDLPNLIDQHQPVALVVDSQDEKLNLLRTKLSLNLPVIRINMRGSLGIAKELGVYDYLVKPIERQQLLNSMAKLEQKPQKILIVDDDPQLVDLLSRMLQSTENEYRLFKAFGGEDALTRLHRHRPDLMLLDMGMSDVDGLTVLKTMRADEDLAGIPVIVISGQEYSELGGSSGGQTMRMMRQDEFSVIELINCLQCLLDALPLRLPARS
jgi:signal transduction histidine kinase/DNA-binding response OmpR family regulator